MKCLIFFRIYISVSVSILLAKYTDTDNKQFHCLSGLQILWPCIPSSIVNFPLFLDKDYEGQICNAILACNKLKSASFQVLKGYIVDFHADVAGSTAKINSALKKAVERATANGLIR